MFFVQACYTDGRIISEEFKECSESDAVEFAKAELKHPTSEAEYTRVLTIDCELVYDSREDQTL